MAARLNSGRFWLSVSALILLQACAAPGPELPELAVAEDGVERQAREELLAYLGQVAESHAQLAIPWEVAAAHRLSLQPQATLPVDIGADPYGRMQRLSPATARAWRALQGAAQADGIELTVLSGFRSVQRQTHLIAYRLSNGEDIEEISTRIALPGYSEHHTGCAIDIVEPDQPALSQEFAETEAYRWLQIHAGRFGFRESYPPGNDHGIIDEPWHWYYTGCEAAPLVGP